MIERIQGDFSGYLLYGPSYPVAAGSRERRYDAEMGKVRIDEKV
ncbi:MAG: hypothetical protein ABIK15_00125 [Pseudomonadota bacterium]